MERIVSSLVTFLRKVAPPASFTYHVIFTHNTVVKVDVNSPKFAGFTHSHIENLPHNTLCECYEAWNEQSKNEWVSRAFYTLITAGYPYPGTGAAARVPIPVYVNEQCGQCEQCVENIECNSHHIQTWHVLWECDAPLYNIVEADDAEAAAAAAGTNRRIDYCLPRATHLINPDLDVVYL